MTYELLVITTPVGVFPEIIKDGYNGFLVHPGDENSIAEKILKLLGNKKLREMMGKNNIDEVSKKFNINLIVSQLSNIYDKILE